MPNRYAAIVPARRTIPGVEEFDYAVPEDSGLEPGDILNIPFRKQEIPAMVVRLSDKSAVADKAKLIENPQLILRAGPLAAQLLEMTAQHTFSSKPTVLNAWIRDVPKKHPLTPAKDSSPARPNIGTPVAPDIRLLLERWEGAQGLFETAKNLSGKTLILTPWQHRADVIAEKLGIPKIHADATPTTYWNAISDFKSSETSTVVATRLGAWLACLADTIIIDEPENDDFKQDELSPRFDTRWIITACKQLKPELKLIAFSTTPRLIAGLNPQTAVPDIDVQAVLDPWQPRSRSSIDGVSQYAFDAIEEAFEEKRHVFVIHGLEGERTRISCRDCGWSAACSSCGFVLSQEKNSARCRKCGRRSAIPDGCPDCGGFDFTKGRVGRERIAEQCLKQFGEGKIQVLTPMEFDAVRPPLRSLVILTDLNPLGGGAEDIRRKERIAIAWRRIAATCSVTGSTLVVHGRREQIDACNEWLLADGLKQFWAKELQDRRVFHYPPAVQFAKLIVDGTELVAQGMKEELKKRLPATWVVNGPYFVPYRANTRTVRHILHVVPLPSAVPETELVRLLSPFTKQALIDLDPIAFFS